MTYEQFKENVRSGRNIFLTGAGGSGKSWMVSKLISEENDVKIDVTSTTGVSAVNIGGRTIHSFSGIGVVRPDNTLEEIVRKVNGGEGCRSILKCSTLIIDEVSMLSVFYFETLDKVFREIRGSKKPFGGVQLILTGDFLQIPPVDGDFCFKSEVWTSLNLHIIYLKKLYRFTDQKYSEMLERIRVGKQSPEDNAELFERLSEYKKTDVKTLRIQPTFLYSKKVDVHEKNLLELEKNHMPLLEFMARDKGKKETFSILDLMAPKILNLKIGAQVMLTINYNVEDHLCNGSRGIVVSYDEASGQLEVEFMSGKRQPFGRYAFEHKEKDKLISSRHQFPFILAYSLSIHKCQGSTLDCAVVNIGYNIFECSQAYVALSRVRSLSGLYIEAFRPDRIFVDDEVIEFYEKLEEKL